ncbi:MAG: ATP-dependent DNA helicase UvrD2 [Actinomycetota bacterium]|nr:ATP-dependent DNA helicase UvrD2 [Actinomycetota bacterium]
MEETRMFDGLNDEQRRAVQTVRGPVCILAGAGSGKTTTVTRRIAHQVASGAVEPSAILAVTFTDKAAGEMRSRLERLGVTGVRTRTFHAAALGQLRYLAEQQPGDIIASKVVALRQLANSLPKPYRFRPAADLATEIEWAKNRRIRPDAYQSSLGSHQPPIPADLMAGIYRRYEEGKSRRGLIDFEDVLERAIAMFETEPEAREQFTARYSTFTVDEYQDVNLLQETLLRAWVGPRDDLCVVGDDYQSIYGFTGASPRYLLEMPQRFANTTVVRLEDNYRSTPEVLALANRLVPRLGGAQKVLRATRSSGPSPVVRSFTSDEREIDFVVQRVKDLVANGTSLEEIAILYRVNFRSEDYEEALAAEGIPFQVKDGAFLARVTARRMLGSLRRSRSTTVADDVRRLAERAGYLEDPPDDLGEQEMTRQRDMDRFVHLAREFDDGTRSCADFVLDVEGRFGTEGSGRGVNLMSLHKAKGLEFEAVFLPRVEEGELPFKRARSAEAVDEERRLLYVGLTRAKTHLFVSWVGNGKRKGSRFVTELRAGDPEEASPVRQRRAPVGEGPVYERLKKWRSVRARTDGVPAYVVFHDTTLEAIADRLPRSTEDLADVPGIGPAKLDRYGREVIALIEESA